MNKKSTRKSKNILLFLLTGAVFLTSCGLFQGPGILPPVESGSHGEWVIKVVGFTDRNWRIRAAYIPESEEFLILSFDLVATLDGSEVDFNFDDAKQELYFKTSPDLTLGEHEFKVVPASDSSLRFPSLTVRFVKE